MTISRLNYTGRKRINRNDVRITLHEQQGELHSFDADITLGRYRFPDEALVFVEAYRQTFWMRFDFGTVGAIVPPADRRLVDFDSIEGVLFRVKVTSSADRHGIMLGEADKIPVRRPDEIEEDRTPLLPVQPADLGDEIFRVDFSDRPVIQVNKKVDDWRAVARSPAFFSLVYPTAFREILVRILWVDRYYETDDEEDWRSRWLRFAESLPGTSDVPDEGEEEKFDDWIEVVVAAFARAQKLLDCFTDFWQKGGN